MNRPGIQALAIPLLLAALASPAPALLAARGSEPPDPPVVSYAPIQGVVGTGLTGRPESTGGRVASFRVAGSPALPANLVLNAGSGVISGTPSASTNGGTMAVTILARNASGDFSLPVAITILDPTITAPAVVLSPGSDYTASVPAQAGVSYRWRISNGIITAGQNLDGTAGEARITFSPSTPEATIGLSCQLTSLGQGFSASGVAQVRVTARPGATPEPAGSP